MISKRLNKIASFIKDDHDVSDIGSDHGLLLVLLNQKDFKHNVLGVENKIGPYKNLEKTVLSINKENFKSVLGDGLEIVPENYKTIVIAGMGFNNIKNIVLNDLKKGFKRQKFIIDCHTSQKEVRGFFVSLGYSIENEAIVFEDSIYYDIIVFSLSDSKKYTDIELEFGPFNIEKKEELFIQRYNSELEKLKELYNTIDNLDRKNELSKEITKLEEILKWIQKSC